MSLLKYKEKRDFEKTPEPVAKLKKKIGNQFVIQKHLASRLHYDFRLEMDGVLKSWAVPKGPSMNPKDKRLAMMVEDHPYDYKNFEGTIPSGNYGAGTVMVWDEGTYEPYPPHSEEGDKEKILRQGLHKGDLKFILHGKKLRGAFVLAKLKNKEDPSRSSGQDNSWLLIKKADENALSDDVAKLDKSAKTGRTMDEIKFGKKGRDFWISGKNLDLSGANKSEMPHDISPMLATLVLEPFDTPGWLFEIKWDGYRTLSEITKNGTKLYSRNKLSFDELFSPIKESLERLKTEMILDGEVVVLDEEGRSRFQLLQNYKKTGKGFLVYYVFDILYFQGYDLTPLPLKKRKEILRKILPELPNIRISDHIEKEGRAFYRLAKEKGIEGIVGKNAKSPYRVGKRSTEWVKIKTKMRQEAVIGGFTEPKGGRKEMGALVLGVYEGEDLVYIGHTGGGFSETSLREVKGKLNSVVKKKSPFKVSLKTNTKATWVEPKYIAEVEFSEWTEGGNMRQPIFIGLREDKNPKEIKREIPKETKEITKEKMKKTKQEKIEFDVSVDTLKLTNLSKVYFPKDRITKGDLIEYYKAVSDYILPYVLQRPESLHRYPNGINDKKKFWQKDIDQKPDFIKTVKIRSEGEERDIDYLVVTSRASLLYMVNLGCIEINPWFSRVQNLDYPDYFVLDLDPEDISFDAVVECALTVREVMIEAGIEGFCKTSGATGLHIYVPLNGENNFSEVKQFAEIIANLAHRKIPDISSVERSPLKRQKKVYLDYLQNRRGQTLASPYSVRPRDGAPVSTPLLWEEVKPGLDPKKFNIKTIFPRLKEKGDLFEPVLEKGFSLSEALENLSGRESRLLSKN